MQMPTTFSSASFGQNCTLCVQPPQAMLHRHTLSVFIDLPPCFTVVCTALEPDQGSDTQDGALSTEQGLRYDFPRRCRSTHCHGR